MNVKLIFVFSLLYVTSVLAQYYDDYDESEVSLGLGTGLENTIIDYVI